MLESVIGNHGFVDGNKRTASILLRLLLVQSGFVLGAPCDEDIDRELEELVVGIADGRIARDAIEAWLRPRCVRV